MVVSVEGNSGLGGENGGLDGGKGGFGGGNGGFSGENDDFGGGNGGFSGRGRRTTTTTLSPET
jgi:hypothetical protein